MKHILLQCITQGFGFGDIVAVGDEKGEIPLEIAQGLVDEGFAKEYKAPVVGSSELEAQLAKVIEERDELKELNAERDEVLTALEAQLAKVVEERDEALTALELAKGASNGKANTATK